MISTENTTLRWGATALSMTKIVDIKDFPDIGGAPQMLETTTLSDPAQMFIEGIKASAEIAFTCNYTKASYLAVQADAGLPMFYALHLGAAGINGIFSWRGTHSVRLVGAGVNAVTEMVITIAPSSQPVLS